MVSKGLTSRRERPDAWTRVEHPIKIRNGTNDLWHKHADVDVAAMLLTLPNNLGLSLLSINMLVADAHLKEWEINPGTELFCLGYPLGTEANAEGFPILRSGKIASYPFLPTKTTKGFLFDFTVFGGNSGGPVYLHDDSVTFGGGFQSGLTIRGIVGLVVEQTIFSEFTERINEQSLNQTPLMMGRVIHATFIREVIDSIPDPANIQLPGPITVPPLKPSP